MRNLKQQWNRAIPKWLLWQPNVFGWTMIHRISKIVLVFDCYLCPIAKTVLNWLSCSVNIYLASGFSVSNILLVDHISPKEWTNIILPSQHNFFFENSKINIKHTLRKHTWTCSGWGSVQSPSLQRGVWHSVPPQLRRYWEFIATKKRRVSLVKGVASERWAVLQRKAMHPHGNRQYKLIFTGFKTEGTQSWVCWGSGYRRSWGEY